MPERREGEKKKIMYGSKHKNRKEREKISSGK